MAQLEGGWPERVLVMQRNWIGKSYGAKLRFAVAAASGGAGAEGDAIEVFTTRIDTIYGASAVILAPEHPLLPKLVAGVAGRAAIEAQLARLRQKIVRPIELATAERERLHLALCHINALSRATPAICR